MILTKIKILVDAHIFDNSFQGSGTYLQGLYNSLVKFDNIEISICAHDIENIKQYFMDERFKFIQLNTTSKYKRMLFELPQIIKKGEFNYAHFTYTVPFNKECRYILTIHDLLFLRFKNFFPWTYRFFKGILFRFSAKKADIILTVSEYSKNTLLSIFKINNNKIFVTPNAVFLSGISGIDIKNKYSLNKYILYVSRFEPRKNHIGLLKAYLTLELYKKGYELVFIGSKAEKIELNAYHKLVKIMPSSIRDKVHFYEKIKQDELNSFYQNAACSVYPSFAEGFGIPPLEAAINDCKVLCSNQTALADFIFFKYHFDPNDQKDFESQLNSILQDENYPYDKIKSDIIKKYDWNEIARNYYAIIQDNLISL